jgi:aminopeptidase N
VRPRLTLALFLAASSAGAQQKAFHVVDYDLAIDLPDAGRTISGLATLTVQRLRAADTLVLDLVDLKVRRVWQPRGPTAFTQDAAHVRIFVGGDRADTLRVSLEYGGEVKDGLVISSDSAGRWVAFGDNFPNRGRQWIPSIDHPSDKATVTWTVRAPSDRRIVANGRLLEETPLPVPRDPDGAAGRPIARTLTRWRESRPIPVYLMVIAAAPLARYELGPTACRLPEQDCVEQTVYVAPEQRGILPGDFARAGDIVDFFSRTVGPFPFEKLAHLQSSTRFGGMENASAIFYADQLFRKRGVNGELIAHETAHQWFGDAVTESEWAHVWLSEGFATYFNSLWVRHAYGDTAFRAGLERMRAVLLRADEVASRPVIDTEQASVIPALSRNTYEKGGWTLHMLRAQVGDSAFFQGVRDYWVSHRYGNALTDDLQHAVEARAGTKLGWLFDQWLRRPGYASITTSWRYDPATQRADLVVEQGDRFGFYRFPLTIDVTDASGVVHRVKVEVPAQKSTRVVLPLILSAAPRALAFDPAVELLAEFRTK